MERCEKTKEVCSFYLARSVSGGSDYRMRRTDVFQEPTQAEDAFRKEIEAATIPLRPLPGEVEPEEGEADEIWWDEGTLRSWRP